MEEKSNKTGKLNVQELPQGVKNILAVYFTATAQEIEHGMEWYNIAHKIARRISKGTGVDVDTVAGVISALSPSNRWERNVQDTESLIQAHQAGLNQFEVKVSTYGQNKKKAWGLLDGDDPHKAFGGKSGWKTEAFFKLIADPTEDYVVIDGHATNIWEGDYVALKDATKLNKTTYFKVVEDYRIAAALIGVYPHQMQAITWLAWRRMNGVDWGG